jgi:hypothetical protein
MSYPIYDLKTTLTRGLPFESQFDSKKGEFISQHTLTISFLNFSATRYITKR